MIKYSQQVVCYTEWQIIYTIPCFAPPSFVMSIGCYLCQVNVKCKNKIIIPGKSSTLEWKIHWFCFQFIFIYINGVRSICYLSTELHLNTVFAVVVLGTLSNGTFLKELISAHKVNLRGFWELTVWIGFTRIEKIN